MECEWCSAPIEARKTGRKARFCSGRCRVASHRAVRLPARLTDEPRWTSRDGKRPTMVDGSPASSTNPETWATYVEVKAGPHGVMLGEGLACWDLDHCVIAGQLEPWAQTILDGCDPIWVEVSMSGTGLHIFVEAAEGPGSRRGQIEFYSRGRFIAVTGERFRYSSRGATRPAGATTPSSD